LPGAAGLARKAPPESLRNCFGVASISRVASAGAAPSAPERPRPKASPRG
jgi:hypothetical protein